MGKREGEGEGEREIILFRCGVVGMGTCFLEGGGREGMQVCLSLIHWEEGGGERGGRAGRVTQDEERTKRGQTQRYRMSRHFHFLVVQKDLDLCTTYLMWPTGTKVFGTTTYASTYIDTVYPRIGGRAQEFNWWNLDVPGELQVLASLPLTANSQLHRTGCIKYFKVQHPACILQLTDQLANYQDSTVLLLFLLPSPPPPSTRE